MKLEEKQTSILNLTSKLSSIEYILMHRPEGTAFLIENAWKNAIKNLQDGSVRYYTDGFYTYLSIVLINKLKLPSGRSEPHLISKRGRGVIDVIHRYGQHYVGRTNRSLYWRNIEQYKQYVRKLNENLRQQKGFVARLTLFKLVEEGEILLSELTEENQVFWDEYQEEKMRNEQDFGIQ